MALASRETPLGAEVPEVSMALTPERFEAWYRSRPGMPTQNLHVDPDAARREGLPAPVADGPDVANLLFRSMHTFFGAGWEAEGGGTVTIRRPIFAGDFVTAKGFVKMVELLDSGDLRLHCEVWVEDQNGERKIVGTLHGTVR